MTKKEEFHSKSWIYGHKIWIKWEKTGKSAIPRSRKENLTEEKLFGVCRVIGVDFETNCTVSREVGEG